MGKNNNRRRTRRSSKRNRNWKTANGGISPTMIKYGRPKATFIEDTELIMETKQVGS